MGKKHYPTGVLPVDAVPARADKAPRGVDNLADRLEAMVGNVRTSPLTQLQAAMYLHRIEDGRELALYLGVSDAFDGITRVRAREAIQTD